VRPEPLEALRVAQELDDLEQFGLRLVRPGDVAPGDRARGVLDGRCRLDPRHHLEEAPEQVEQEPVEEEEEQRPPVDDEVAEQYEKAVNVTHGQRIGRKRAIP
jgi:hypothetical protein